jgi:Fe-S-cluster containining protein
VPRLLLLLPGHPGDQAGRHAHCEALRSFAGEAERRFFHADHGYKRLLNRQPDEHYGRICQFFDTDARNCTIYKARPAACRDYPGNTCGYWDFLQFERAGQKDDEYVSTTWHDKD